MIRTQAFKKEGETDKEDIKVNKRDTTNHTFLNILTVHIELASKEHIKCAK